MTASYALRRGTQVALLVIAGAGIVASSRLGMWGFEGPGSGLFPMIASLLLLICVAPRLVIADTGDEAAEPVNWRRLAFYALSLVVYVVLFIYAGFAIGTVVGVFMIMHMAEERPVFRSLVASIVATAGCMLLFDYLLSVPLPYGPLEPFKFWM